MALEPKKKETVTVQRIILDTDIGDDIDDAYALAFALNSPDLELEAVLTTGGRVQERAHLARELVRRAGQQVPVFCGLDGIHEGGRLSQRLGGTEDGGPAPRLEESIEAIRALLANGPTTLVSIGGLTNVTHLLDRLEPAAMQALELVLMAGSFHRDYHGASRIVPESNIIRDIDAVRRVLRSDVPITLVPLDCTWNVALTAPRLERVHRPVDPLRAALRELYAQWRRVYGFPFPILHDPLAVALSADESLARFETRRVRVDEHGYTRTVADGRPCRIAVELDREQFLDRFARALIVGRRRVPA